MEFVFVPQKRVPQRTSTSGPIGLSALFYLMLFKDFVGFPFGNQIGFRLVEVEVYVEVGGGAYFSEHSKVLYFFKSIPTPNVGIHPATYRI